MAVDSRRTADKVSEILPIHLTSRDVEQNPEFVKLLTSLSKHITKDGVSTGLSKDLEEAKASLRQEKGHWLEQHVLYTELRELLLDQQLKAGQSTPSSNSQFYKVVGEMLTLTEIQDYLECHPDPSSDVTLLGLKKDDIDRRNPHKRHIQSIQQKLIPEIESRLRKRCENLVSFHDSCKIPSATNGESGKLVFAKASQLPSVLETEQLLLDEERQQLQQDKASRDRQLTQYYQTLVDSLRTLETLISKHRLRSQSQSDRISSEWLTARCDAMYLKVKTLELQLLCDTYYSDTVQALSTIRRHLDKSVSDTEDELAKASEALKAYEAVGMGMASLVDDYTHLRSEIDNKNWALKELHQHGIEDDTFS